MRELTVVGLDVDGTTMPTGRPDGLSPIGATALARRLAGHRLGVRADAVLLRVPRQELDVGGEAGRRERGLHNLDPLLARVEELRTA